MSGPGVFTAPAGHSLSVLVILHGHPVRLARRAGGAGRANGAGGGVPARLRAGTALDRFAGHPQCRKSTLLSCTHGRARPGPAGRGGRRGLRGRHPTAQPRRPGRASARSSRGRARSMTSGNRMSGDLCLWALADAEHETRHVPTRMSALPGHAASRIIADLGIARVRNVRVGPPTRL
jgi:hypothetical protein